MKNCFLQGIIVKSSRLGMSRMEVENWPQYMSTTMWINYVIMGNVLYSTLPMGNVLYSKLYSFSSVRVTR